MDNPGAALVTGGARRVGKAIALELARRGYDIAIHYNNSKREAEETAIEIESTGVLAKTVKADLCDGGSVEGLIDQSRHELGGSLTVLVNNASVFENDSIDSATRQSWTRHMNANFHAPFVLAQEFARQSPPPEIDENGEPVAVCSVINIVDQCVEIPSAEFVSYTLSKMGLWSFTRVAAVALAPDIRVNAIAPGPTLIGSRQSMPHFKRQRNSAPLRRSSDVTDLVAALRFILDSNALTGQLICIDGGRQLAEMPLQSDFIEAMKFESNK